VNSNNLAIKASGLTRRFGKFTAVDHIDLEVKEGEVFGFLGANGAGKTTAIRMFCGLLKPTDGDAWIGGISVLDDPARIKKRIGYMSQKFSLYDELKVVENLEFFAGAYNIPASNTRIRIQEILSQFNLVSMEHRFTRQLSLGLKQRLALGCAMLHSPEILFLDEPTGGVDPVTRRNFWTSIHNLASAGTTVFVTTHYMDEAEYCHRISIMNHGKIIALGSPQSLKQSYQLPTIQDVFVHLIKTQ